MVRQRRSTINRYGCLLTYLTTRAVHLEMTADLSTSSFINTLRRFIARRGPIKRIFSDKGTNFVGSNKALKAAVKEWNQRQIHVCLRQKAIDWSFNPPGSSHMGDSRERMIRTVRKILIVLLSRYTIEDDTLHTLLLEVKSMVNSRPLCESVAPGSETPLTPNHLLRIDTSIGLSPVFTDPSDSFVRHQRYRLVQHVADQFWKRWVDEYARTILLRKKWFERKRNVMEGDIVLVLESNTPRGHRPIGKFLRCFPDKHGVVRSVDVKTATGESIRPIAKLCVILPADDKGKSTSGGVQPNNASDSS